MIARSVVQEVRQRLAEGNLSQRKIAKITGISRGTVGAIAAGKRPDYQPLQHTAKDEFPGPTGPLRRCPGCGGMVYMPCRLCHTRAVKARSSTRLSSPKSRSPILRRPLQLDEPLGLDLTDEDRARYEAIRAKKVSAESEPDRDEVWDALEWDDDECELDPADLWDALEWDDEEPAIEEVSVPDLGESSTSSVESLSQFQYEELLTPDSI